MDAVFHVDRQITQAGLSTSITLESELMMEKFSVPFAPSTQTGVTRQSTNPDSSSSFLLDKPQLPSTLGKVDPIDEAPRKIWYFRSKQLGEKGPLRPKMMREHLDNGDVSIGCIVWREDWEDWQPAERVFPKLVALAEKNKADELIRQSAHKIPDELNPHSALQRRKRQTQLVGIIAIAAGLLTIGLLVLFLIKLLSN